MNITAFINKINSESKTVKLLESLTGKKVTFLNEKISVGKDYVSKGQLSQEDLDTLISIDPSANKKYVDWLSKVWINEKPDLDTLRNTIEEFNTFANKGKAKTKDFMQFNSFTDMQKEVTDINNTGEGISVKELESDYDVIKDTPDLYIVSPHTHEASRKLGITKFAYRDCVDESGVKSGGKDSAWCTTYKTGDHFNDYYYANNVTFYYILVRSKELQERLKLELKSKRYVVVALAVLDDGQIDGYDGLDKQMSAKNIKKYRAIVGI